MIYINTPNTNKLVTINGTESTEMELINNQTKQTYNIDLTPLYYQRQFEFTRKELNIMIYWVTDISTINNVRIKGGQTTAWLKFQIESHTLFPFEGVNYLYIGNGEYTYTIDEVKGLMKLVSSPTQQVYQNNENNIVYKG